MADQINDGGPAFPYTNPGPDVGPDQHGNAGYSGMTLRDWFAGQALSGLMASGALDECLRVLQTTPGHRPDSAPAYAAIAAWSHMAADAMLAASKETPND